MNKLKLLIIAIVILVALFAALLIYNLFFKDEATRPLNMASLPAPEELATESLEETPRIEAGVRRVSEEPVVGFELTGGSVTAFLTTAVAQFDVTGDLINEQQLPFEARPYIVAIDPSDNRIAFQGEQGDRSGWFMYNLEDKKLESLPYAVLTLAFSPSGVTARVEQNEDGTMSVVRQEETSTRFLSIPRIPDPVISWVDETTIVLSTLSSGKAPGILYLLDVDSGRITRVLGNRYGLAALVSSTKDWALFSETDSAGKQLVSKIINLETRAEQALPFATLPQKCSFAPVNDQILYCAAFLSSPARNIMPDDYIKDVFENKRSALVRVNLETGLIETLVSSLPFDPVSLRLAPDEDGLFFINKHDGLLHYLPL